MACSLYISNIADMGHHSDKGAEFSLYPVSPSGWIGPSALKNIDVPIPGALRQAGMDRASGPLELMPMVNLYLKERTKAPKAKTMSAWGNAPGTVETKREQGLQARSITLRHALTRVGSHLIQTISSHVRSYEGAQPASGPLPRGKRNGCASETRPSSPASR